MKITRFESSTRILYERRALDIQMRDENDDLININIFYNTLVDEKTNNIVHRIVRCVADDLDWEPGERWDLSLHQALSEVEHFDEALADRVINLLDKMGIEYV